MVYLFPVPKGDLYLKLMLSQDKVSLGIRYVCRGVLF